MTRSTRAVLAVVLAGIWVYASEFLRNEVLLNNHWVDHYRALGLVFPSEPINGAVWVMWGFLFAWAIWLLTRRFSLVQAALLAWLMGFVLMWLVIGNLHVLPVSILVYALPLSLIEVLGAAYIAKKCEQHVRGLPPK